MPQDDCTMEIIGIDNNLDNLLRDVKNSRVDIAVAFATKTEKVIDALIVNGNEVFLTVGTINCFSDPVFFRHCQELAQENSKLNLAVDFRYADSIHWKVYLISPNIVVIGSANFTKTGLSMSRDTAVHIEDENLYTDYQALLSSLRNENNVVALIDDGFDTLLSEYEKKHRLPIPTRNIRSGQLPSFTEWFARDESQGLPILIWDQDFDDEHRNTFENKIVPTLDPTDNNGTYFLAAVIFSKPPSYYERNSVLILSDKGTYPQFNFINLIMPSNDKWYLCGIEGAAFPNPFALSPDLKKAIKSSVQKWAKNDKTFLDTKDLQELADKLPANLI